jgi:hypothetical protein
MAAADLHVASPGAAIPILSELELAAMRAEEGDDVVSRHGCHWRNAYPGFYQPTHLMARIPAMEVRSPARLCWGFRAALRAEDAHRANASVPVHLLTGLDSFDEARLSRNRRSDLRRARRLVEFRRLADPGLLLEQGYEVFLSAQQRLGYWRSLSPREYCQRVQRRATHGARMFIAGLIDGRLRGYLDSFAVDGVLYTDEIFVATDALRTGIGTGLYVETFSAATREGALHSICNGLHRPESPDLCRFKAGLGFEVVQLPARVVMSAPIRAYIRAQRPATYYRLTGDERALGACEISRVDAAR